MNTRIKTILENNATTARDYFNLINIFEYSVLTLYKENKSIFSMEVNSFSGESKELEFAQEYSETKYSVEESDIESTEAKMLGELDTLFIAAKMANGLELNICIYHTDTYTKTTKRERYYEMDVYSLKDYLDSKSNTNVIHKPMMAIVRDAYGLEIKLSTVASAYVMEDEEEGLSLHIQDGMATTIGFPLMDDGCNAVFIKENENFDSILVKPYGQPFMEISLLIHKEEVKNPHLVVVK